VVEKLQQNSALVGVNCWKNQPLFQQSSHAEKRLALVQKSLKQVHWRTCFYRRRSVIAVIDARRLIFY
jgi:hypothetical protein